MTTKRPSRTAAATGTRSANTPQMRPNRGGSDSPTPPNADLRLEDIVNNCEQAKSWLEKKNLLVPLGATVTPPMLSTALFHISELARMPGEIAQAIRSVAWLLGEMEEEVIATSTRAAVNDHIDYMNVEAKNMLDEIRETIAGEVTKHLESISSAAAKATDNRVAPALTYRDAALRGGPFPQGTDPRVLAREGIRARQFIVDFPENAPIRSLGQSEVLKRFNEVMLRVGGELSEGERRIRSVQKLVNKGFMGEFFQDEGAKWFAQQTNADSFIAALGVEGEGASVKKQAKPSK